MYTFLKQIFFLCNIFFIIFSEVSMYIIFKNYNCFIERFTKRLASINILYVKIFQAIALNNHLIDDNINNKLLKFTDNAPWNYNDINLHELIELTNDYNIHLCNGYEKPINSGMISLVFKGYKKDSGEKIIIKMKRNNIEEKLNESIQNLETFMYILSFIPIINKYQISNVVIKNIDIIKHQTDFSNEVQNMVQMKKNCKNIKYIKIPEVYREITEIYPNFIVMEYIEGYKINEIEKEDYNDYAELILKFGFVTTLIHGITHGDLHSGNILFIKDDNTEKYKYKIGIIDFGIVYELDQQYREELFNILTNIFEITPREISIKLFNSCIIDPPNFFDQISNEHRENIIRFTSEIIEETLYVSKKANQLQIYKFICKLNEYLNKTEMNNIGIKPSDNFIKTQLVIAMAHGVTLTLCKEHYIDIADKVLNDLFHTKIIM